MNVVEVQMWHFRCFGSDDPRTDGKPDPKPVRVNLDAEITGLIGRNGSGKSALLEALQRVFGETRDERTIRQEDFFVPPGETLDKQPKREMFIEILISFAELVKGATASKHTVPASFKHMIVDGPGKTPIARVRLEATWQAVDLYAHPARCRQAERDPSVSGIGLLPGGHDLKANAQQIAI